MTIKLKKTSVHNRTPNTFTLSADGDVGINTHDGKAWISNGSIVHELGANISGNSYVGSNLYIQDTITHVNGIYLDIDNPSSGQPGTLTWNTEEDCLNIYHEDGSILQTGLESYVRVRNHTGNTLLQGTLVQFSGVNGDANPTCVPLLANSTFDPHYTIGVLTNDVPNGEVGRATTFGKVRQLNTTGSEVSESWAVGDILWASSTHDGKLTKVKPTAPYPAISVAAVVKSGITDGEILVRPLIFPRLYYGNFSSNTTQNCASSNTATVVSFNRTEFASGHEIVGYPGNTGIKALVSGLYSYQFSLQLTSSSSSRSTVWIWARKNGIDIPDSATRVSLESNGGLLAPAWNFVVSMAANSVFQLMWATNDHTKVSMSAEASGAFHPSVPSALLSVTQVNQ